MSGIDKHMFADGSSWWISPKKHGLWSY